MLSITDELLARIRDQFLENGCVVLEGFFDFDQLADCSRGATEHFEVNTDITQPENFRVAQCEVKGWHPIEENVPSYFALAADPRLRRATEAVLGGPYEEMGSLVMFSPPHSAGQAWHQDCPCDDPARFNLNRLIYAWDVGAHGGETVVVPGSHKTGILPPGSPTGHLPRERVLSPRTGTLVFLHGFTYHRVLPVRDRPRISINLRVVPRGAPTDITRVATYRNMKYDFNTREVVETRVWE